jgi:hypothetical protein
MHAEVKDNNRRRHPIANKESSSPPSRQQSINNIEYASIATLTSFIIASFFANSWTFTNANAQEGVQQYSLTVSTQDATGNTINGYYTTLSQNGNLISSGYSTVTFSLAGSQSYTVSVQDYGDYVFDHWKDTGSKNRDRTISISSDTSIVAVYRNVNSPASSSTPSSTPSSTSSGGHSSLTISSENSQGNSISGYYTTLSQNGAVITTGFTVVTFTLDNGQTYTVSVQDYGDYVFDHWKDTGSKNRDRTISISSDTNIVAVYRNINGDSSSTSSPSPSPSPTPTPAPSSNSTTNSIVLTKSGLVASDSLTNGNYDRSQLDSNNPNKWTYYGSAPVEGAPYDYYEDTSVGLHLGVQAPGSGQWAGFFAETPALSAQTYHAILTIPYSSTADNSFNTGLYVQTANGLINYITCAAEATPSGNSWSIVWATGNTEQATSYQTLWSDTSASQPKTRDCTIITNGDNFLQVYLDNQQVYSSSSLHLQMPAPFNAFLEVQSSTSTAMLYGTYKDYYATSNSIITVGNATAGSIVKVVRSGSTVATGTVDSNGNANIDLGRYHFPLSASIQVYDSSNQQMIASSASDVNIWGGDTYIIKTKTA